MLIVLEDLRIWDSIVGLVARMISYFDDYLGL